MEFWSCRIVEELSGGVVVLSNRRIVDWWDGGFVELSNRRMVKLCSAVVDLSNGREVELCSCRIVESSIGGIVDLWNCQMV